MASFVKDAVVQSLMNLLLGAVAYTPPATVYAALGTALAADGSFTEVVSGSGTGQWNGYARVAVTNNTTNWPSVSGAGNRTKSNGTAISFGTASIAGGGGPTVVAVALYDAATNGNMLAVGSLTSNQQITNGQAVSFPAGAFTLAWPVSLG